MQSTPPARQIAMLILLILLVGSGFAAAFTVGGHTETSLQICGATIATSIVVLIVGGLAVASSGRR